MRKTCLRIGTDRAELSNHDLATHGIEEYSQNIRVIPLLRNKEREVLYAGGKAKSSGGGHLAEGRKFCDPWVWTGNLE